MYVYICIYILGDLEPECMLWVVLQQQLQSELQPAGCHELLLSCSVQAGGLAGGRQSGLEAWRLGDLERWASGAVLVLQVPCSLLESA